MPNTAGVELIAKEFLTRSSYKLINDNTDGTSWFFHKNKIAWFDENNDLWISNSGWATASTYRRLNLLPEVRIYVKDGDSFLNGEEWDGRPIKIEKVYM